MIVEVFEVTLENLVDDFVKRLSNRGESSRDYNRFEKWQGSTIIFYYFG